MYSYIAEIIWDKFSVKWSDMLFFNFSIYHSNEYCKWLILNDLFHHLFHSLISYHLSSTDWLSNLLKTILLLVKYHSTRGDCIPVFCVALRGSVLVALLLLWLLFLLYSRRSINDLFLDLHVFDIIINHIGVFYSLLVLLEISSLVIISDNTMIIVVIDYNNTISMDICSLFIFFR